MTERYNAIFITRKIFFYGILTILPAFLFRPWQADLSLLILGGVYFAGKKPHSI